jgi:hypothetical protein
LLKFMGGIPELLRRSFCMSRCRAGLAMMVSSSSCSGGVEGGSEGSELSRPGVSRRGDSAACRDLDEARRPELEEFEEVVESWYSTTTSQVCRVASGAKETRRFARDLRRASRRESVSFCSSCLSCSSRSRAAACCSSSVRKEIRVSLTAALCST